jgi:hypothetical protein
VESSDEARQAEHKRIAGLLSAKLQPGEGYFVSRQWLSGPWPPWLRKEPLI